VSDTTRLPDPVPSGAVHVTAAIVVQGSRVLVARRVRPPELAGLWEFPGGKVEAGEAPESALARELVEELGCEVRVVAFVARSVDSERARPLVLDAYRCALVSGEPRPDPHDGTHDEVQWVDAAELVALTSGGGLAPLDVPLAASVLETLAAGPDNLSPPAP
jgi:8-oxo-dGTP diphosphatase